MGGSILRRIISIGASGLIAHTARSMNSDMSKKGWCDDD